MNDYHGNLPAHTTVLRGTHIQALENQAHSDKTLFMCYPPPGSKMAENAILSFKGEFIALVGETSGDTGTQNFEKILRKDWNMVEKVDLPNFFNTCYHLTIWKREPNVNWPMVCATCGSLPKDVIYRCR